MADAVARGYVFRPRVANRGMNETKPRRGVRTFEDFYRDLSLQEGREPADLIAAWDAREVIDLTSDFRQAFAACDFASSPLNVGSETTDQAVGNRLSPYVVAALNKHLRGYRIEPCQGFGYPDWRLVRCDGRAHAMEFKATRRHGVNDSRMVLTCATEKLRGFAPPVNHLLATAHCRRRGAHAVVETLRLCFLEPTSLVSVRMECALTQRMLSRGISSAVICGAVAAQM